MNREQLETEISKMNREALAKYRASVAAEAA